MSWLNTFLKFREKSDGDIVRDHLQDLQWMLIKILVTLAVCTAISFFFVRDLMEWIQRPLMTVPELQSKIITRTIE